MCLLLDRLRWRMMLMSWLDSLLYLRLYRVNLDQHGDQFAGDRVLGLRFCLSFCLSFYFDRVSVHSTKLDKLRVSHGYDTGYR